MLGWVCACRVVMICRVALHPSNIYRLNCFKVESYKGRATFVHLYGPEPHPKIPGTNFDKGTIWPHFWSAVAQHRDYEGRVAMANQIAHLIHADQVSQSVQSTQKTKRIGRRPLGNGI